MLSDLLIGIVFGFIIAGCLAIIITSKPLIPLEPFWMKCIDCSGSVTPKEFTDNGGLCNECTSTRQGRSQ